MKKLYVFFAVCCVMIFITGTSSAQQKNRVAPDGSFQIDSPPLLQVLEVNAALNYQILSLTLPPTFSDPGILMTPMKWDCDPGILLSPKYINIDPKMLVPFDENKYEKEIHFDDPLHPNSFFSPYLLHGTNPFMNRMELQPPEKLHISDFNGIGVTNK